MIDFVPFLFCRTSFHRIKRAIRCVEDMLNSGPAPRVCGDADTHRELRLLRFLIQVFPYA